MKVEHLMQFNQELNALEKRDGHLTQLGDKMITIYTSNDCVFCKKAVQFCKEESYVYRELPIDNNVLIRIEYLMGFKPRTVPQIFINDQYLGGYTQLKDWHRKCDPTYSESMQDDLEPIS